MSGGVDQRRPSASLRTRRPSTILNEDGSVNRGPSFMHNSGHPVPEVPALPPNHLTPYFSNPFSGNATPIPSPNNVPPGGQQQHQAQRPQMRTAGSSGNRNNSNDARSRSRGGSNTGPHPHAVGGLPQDGSSKVGAILLNKRQSVSFGKAATSNAVKAEMRDAHLNVPLPQSGRAQQGQTSGAGSGRGPSAKGSSGVMTAGEELVAQAPKGPTGAPLSDLLKEDFVADKFIKSHLSPGATDNPQAQLEDLRKLKVALDYMRDATQENLQTNVIQNYGEFIQVSKDIAALENEMLELKSVLEEWKTVPDSLEIEQSFDPNASNGRNRRNSLADLQALYKTQLEALWENIEGSQRFLPQKEGRHVLDRFPGWVELNSATYRPRQNVVLILLNDALLTGVEKRRQMGSAVKTVADKCFHLNEIAVTDLRDAGELTNAIRIKRDREVHIFRTEKPEDKKALLAAFKKILEEAMSRRRKDSVWEAEARRDTAHFGATRTGDSGHNKHPLSSFKPSTVFKFIAHDDPSGKDLSWIDDVSDQLAVHIALHEYEQAVALVEQAKSIFAIVEADPIAIGLLKIKVEIRTSELNQVLLATLADKNIRKTSVIRVSGWLLRLGQGERARETFLAGRGELLKHRTGEIHFTSQDGGGHANRTSSDSSNSVVEEVAELAFVCFTLIRNTCEWYMAAYKDHQTASAFVRWASSQVEIFADLFKRQVYYTATYDEATTQRCLDIAKIQSAMLKDVGLDFAFLLSTALRDDGVRLRPPAEISDKATLNQARPESAFDADHLPPAQPLIISKKKPSGSSGSAPASPAGGAAQTPPPLPRR